MTQHTTITSMARSKAPSLALVNIPSASACVSLVISTLPPFEYSKCTLVFVNLTVTGLYAAIFTTIDFVDSSR